MHPASIAAAVWAYGTRTLATGTPAAPTDRAGRIAQAVWQYVTRTLADAPPPTAGVVCGTLTGGALVSGALTGVDC